MLALRPDIRTWYVVLNQDKTEYQFLNNLQAKGIPGLKNFKLKVILADDNHETHAEVLEGWKDHVSGLSVHKLEANFLPIHFKNLEEIRGNIDTQGEHFLRDLINAHCKTLKRVY